uniref:Uncharacterized protein n=1 Tax=Caenorhabditis tropicalis TaxID=1561998 RepID=A0A1I7V1F0_9PELO
MHGAFNRDFWPPAARIVADTSSRRDLYSYSQGQHLTFCGGSNSQNRTKDQVRQQQEAGNVSDLDGAVSIICSQQSPPAPPLPPSSSCSSPTTTTTNFHRPNLPHHHQWNQLKPPQSYGCGAPLA